MIITIFGNGNIGQAVDQNFVKAGQTVEHIGHEDGQTIHGEIVVLAVPFTAVDNIITRYGEQLAGKIVIDVSNPVNFETFDALTVPAGTSAAAIIQEKLPQSKVVKGFNTNFAATLASGEVAPGVPTTVFLAGDDEEAKEKIVKALAGSPLVVVDAGRLKRAHELEAIGFFQMTLAAREKISWTGGFDLFQ